IGLLEDRDDLGLGELRLLHGTSWLGKHARKFYFCGVYGSGKLTLSAGSPSRDPWHQHEDWRNFVWRGPPRSYGQLASTHALVPVSALLYFGRPLNFTTMIRSSPSTWGSK